MLRCEIRGAVRSDEEELLGLARHLNSVNLPHDRAHVQRLLDHSERSYSGEIKDPRKRKYVFLLRDLETAGVALDSIEVARPTLDDVFLTLTGRTLRDAEAGEGEKEEVA